MATRNNLLGNSTNLLRQPLGPSSAPLVTIFLAVLVSGILGLCCMPRAWAGHGKIIIYPQPESVSDERSSYPLRMLELALSKAGRAYEPRPSKIKMGQSRALLQLASGSDIDVFWSMTSKQRESDLLPIRIPLDKGLLGWRIFLIRQNTQNSFAAIKSVDDLKKMNAIQGHDWPDTEILRASKLPVEGSPHYELLFKLLAQGQVDYFPRSVIEIWDEEKKHPNMGLAIEQTLILEYPTALYFFVNKKNTALAAAIEEGLHIALKDGSFDQLFKRFYGEIIQRAKLRERLKLRLPNPLLPEQTPLQKKELWLQF